MAPPGTRIIAHETPSRRCTWAPHGQDGWYIGPALEHYRCYRVYINKTRSERVVEMMDFFSTEAHLPFQSTRDLATEAAKQLTRTDQPTTGRPICSGWKLSTHLSQEVGGNFLRCITQPQTKNSNPPSQ
jgi:hypothetical protein